MGRSCRPFGKQIRFACTACCWCQGARIAVATCAMPFSTCLKRDVNGGSLPKDFETRLIPPPRRSRCTAARDDRRQITAGCGLPASARQLTEFPEICSRTLLHLFSAVIGTKQHCAYRSSAWREAEVLRTRSEGLGRPREIGRASARGRGEET